MGPKKGSLKKELPKKENSIKNLSIDDPLNSDTWRCVVVMAVEKTLADCFIMKEFTEEASTGRRQQVKVIHYETFLMKILNDFASGELSFNYVYLLNFSTVFQEAAEYVKNKEEIPIPFLVKVVKALLFFLREESLIKIERKAMGPPDPIKEMAERPSNPGGPSPNVKMNEKTGDKGKKAGAQPEGGLKVKPVSATKAETTLLKRGEEAKEDQRIDDSPLNSYFHLYVLLTGFYHPDLPLELLKADIPLYGFLCIDTSLSAVKQVSVMSHGKYQRRVSEEKSKNIQHFWDSFLKILWDPDVNFFFRDTVFQVYVPQKLLCNKKNMKEFIYKEISFLLYDMSDLKRQHENYLKNLKLWDVEEKEKVEVKEKYIFELDDLPSECTSVPVILQCVIDMICGEDGKSVQKSVSFDSIDADSLESTKSKINISPSNVAKYGSKTLFPLFSQIFQEKSNTNTFEIFTKTKELDITYDLDENYFYTSSDKIYDYDTTSEATCRIQKNRNYAENMEEALNSEDGVFRSYWKKFKKLQESTAIVLDYCLYLLLMTKVVCPYELISKTSSEKSFCESSNTKNSNFELIKNMEEEIRKPHFTVTEGSRSILRSIPYNVKNFNRNFFCPNEYKIVTPEKLKASSALEFHVPTRLTTEMSYISDFFMPCELLQNIDLNVYENLGEFLGDYFFSNINCFHFIEELNKSKLLSKELQFWNNYNCSDYIYSVLADSIFVVLHNRTDSDNMSHETFNQSLKTKVGLRDFFEYVLEDESPWFITQEKIYKSQMTLMGKNTSEVSPLRETNDSDFWLESSIKYQERLKMETELIKDVKDDNNKLLEKTNEIQKPEKSVKSKKNSLNKDVRKDIGKDLEEIVTEFIIPKTEEVYYFEGYDIGGVALQYSGLKTCYHVDDCSITVDLMEKLYGNQDLGVHINQSGHSLHLYSFVCPEPHLLDPYTCHLVYKNGIIVALSRRFVESYEKVEKIIENRKSSHSRSKKSLLDADLEGNSKIFRKVPIVKKDDEFLYDMKLSLPNSLSVEVVRKIAKPCYIKQKFIQANGYPEKKEEETSRLFLPNGDVVKMMRDGTIYILKINTTVFYASLGDLTKYGISESFADGDGIQTNKLGFSKYHIITSLGEFRLVDHENIISSEKYCIFQNTDVQSKTIYFRRKDETYYMMKGDGSLCIQFPDGTKMFSSVFVKEDQKYQEETSKEGGFNTESDEETLGEVDEEFEFVFVYMEMIIEHPDYATVIYNQYTQKWKIRLPYDSTITVEPDGNYDVVIDKLTEFKINGDIIQMDRLSTDNKLKCAVTTDLKVFESPEFKGCYCKMEDWTGRRFVVEVNSNCYLEDMFSDVDTVYEELEEKTEEPEKSLSVGNSANVEVLMGCESFQKPRTGSKLSREKKYFMVRRDISGFEALHQDDVQQILTNIKKGSLVYTQDIPGNEKLRCFVLISEVPIQKNKSQKWEVDTILPDPKYVPRATPQTTSSLYGSPPSWMHPFPKQKNKFKVPEKLTCRVFMEIKRTDFHPSKATLDCFYCEMNEVPEIQHSRIEPGIRNIQNYMMKLANDDQDTLKEIYSLVAWEVLNEKKKLKPINTEKLEHYLAMSKYYVEMQEYHKQCIRFLLIPNYFQHPAGMSWLILNNLIDRLTLGESQKSQKLLVASLPTSEPTFVLSEEEIEYNISWPSEPSYSELSYRSGISMKSAPSVLKAAVCTCKLRPTRQTVSAPIYKLKDKAQEENFNGIQENICTFKEEDFAELGKKKSEEESNEMTLEDLMFLGLM